MASYGTDIVDLDISLDARGRFVVRPQLGHVALLSELRGTRRKDGTWSFPPDPDIIEDLKENNLTMYLSEDARHLLGRYTNRQGTLNYAAAAACAPAKEFERLDNLKFENHQIKGATWMVVGRRCMLNDNFGAGKTVTAVGALERIWHEARKVLIITEPIYRIGWQRHLHEWGVPTPGVILKGSFEDRRATVSLAADRPRAILITNYQALAPRKRRAGKGAGKQFGGIPSLGNIAWDLIILDEPHHIKNRKSKVFQFVSYLTGRAKYVWLLGGAIIHNTPADSWALLHVMHPSRFTSYWQFAERFCKVDELPFTKVGGLRDDRKERFVKTLKQYVLRREVKYPRRDTKLWIDGTEDEEFYSPYEEMVRTNITPTGEMLTSPVTKMMRAMQYVTDPSMFDVWLDGLSPKLRALSTLLEKQIGPIVVASYFTSEFNRYVGMYVQQGYRAAAIYQETKTDDRQWLIDKFQEGGLDLLFLGIKTGGTAITLTESHNLFMLSPHFNPVMNEQAVGRLLRRGQQSTVVVSSPVIMGTVDLWVDKLLADKIDVIQYVQENGLTHEQLTYQN